MFGNKPEIEKQNEKDKEMSTYYVVQPATPPNTGPRSILHDPLAHAGLSIFQPQRILPNRKGFVTERTSETHFCH